MEPAPGWGPEDEGREDGSSPLDRLRRAWYVATGAWPRRWSPPARPGSRSDDAAAAEEEGGDDRRQPAGFKLLPAPGSPAARLIGGGAIPHSAGVFETARPSPPGDQAQPPLAVMVGWFNAEKRHVDKHIALYHPLASAEAEEQGGWDVLWFPVPSYTCLIPFGGYKLAEKILGVLELLLVHPRPLVLHLISGGAFIFGAMVDIMRHLPNGGPLPASAGLATATPSANTYDAIRRNLRGIVYDSPVGVPGKSHDYNWHLGCILRKMPAISLPTGIGNAVCGVVGLGHSSALGVGLKALLGLYFACTYPLTLAALCRIYFVYRHQDLMFPGIRYLFVFSDDDQVASPAVVRS